MDHYTAEAYEHVRKRIVGHIDRLEKYGKQGSGDIHNLKNWRRFGSGFAWDPEVYVDIMKDPDMSDADLMKALRNTEANLMKKWAVIDKMPMHHKVALRTGGDLGLRTPVDVWMQTRERLYDRFGFNPGNGPANLGPQSQFNEGIHLYREGAGVYKEAGMPEEVLKQLKLDEVGLHRAGQDLGNKPSQYTPLIGANSQQQAAYLEEFIVDQIKRFEQATNYERTRWERDTFDAGANWLANIGGEGLKISGYSTANTIPEQEILKAAGKAISYKDPITGNAVPLARASADAFIADKAPKINPANFSLDTSSKQGKNLLKILQDNLQEARARNQVDEIVKAANNPLARRMSGLLPVAGTALGATFMDKVAEDRDKEIKANPNDASLKINKTLDQISGWGDRTTLTGLGLLMGGEMASLAGIPVMAAGEATSLTSGLGSLAIDAARQVPKTLSSLQDKAIEMKKSVAHKNNPNDYGITEALRINGPNQLKIFADLQGALRLGSR